MRYVLMLMMVLIGMTLPLQAGINARLREILESPVLAAATNFLVGLTVLGCVWVVSYLAGWMSGPNLSKIGQAPAWVFLGGVCGAAVVLGSLLSVKPLGAAVLISCLVLGQMISSVLADHHGWVGYNIRTVSWERILGIVLLVAGVMLLQHTGKVVGAE